MPDVDCKGHQGNLQQRKTTCKEVDRNKLHGTGIDKNTAQGSPVPGVAPTVHQQTKRHAGKKYPHKTGMVRGKAAFAAFNLFDMIKSPLSGKYRKSN